MHTIQIHDSYGTVGESTVIPLRLNELSQASPVHPGNLDDGNHTTAPTQTQTRPGRTSLDPVRIKNRRKHYLDTCPSYFSPRLELADPLLYDRLIRRFQTASEREAEGRSKGFSGILEADIARSEARMHALSHPDPHAVFGYQRGKNGEIFEEDRDEVPASKEEGLARWRWEMEMRFLRGDDVDFDYRAVDESEEYDDRGEEDREELDRYLDNETPKFLLEDGRSPQGETGVQDY